MAKIPASVLSRSTTLPGLKLLSQGKVRDTYELPGHSDKLLVVASDRISVFDIILSALVRDKGRVLTAMNVFWAKQLAQICEQDIVAFGAAIDEYLPADLRRQLDLQTRAIVVRKLDMLPFEAIVRLHLTGSGWESYQQKRMVCGHPLPPGLQDGSRLPYALFTPTTKATEGHDEHVTADSVSRRFPGIERPSLQLAQQASEIARQRGIILADTKFEFGFYRHPSRPDGIYVLGDERLTPDSSRYWPADAWEAALLKGKLPPSFDKQFVRDFIKMLKMGEIPFNKLDPTNPEHLAWAHAQAVPEDVLVKTTQLYRYIFWRLTGKKLERFQREEMGIITDPSQVQLNLIFGSRSDLDDGTKSYLRTIASNPGVDLQVHILSCHRNPQELVNFASGHAVNIKPGQSPVIVAAAGKAAALPGVLKGWLNHFGNNTPVIGVGLPGATDDASDAAALSIEELPGRPVEVDSDGQAFTGVAAACAAAIDNEFLPRVIEKKPAEAYITI